MGAGWVSVDVDTTGLFTTSMKLRLAPKEVELAGRAATAEATEYAASVIRDFTPVATGAGRGGVPSRRSGEKTLRDSWVTRVHSVGPSYQGEVINRKAYAAAVERGARARTIEPKEGNTWLQWPGILQEYGRRHFKSVNWPGFSGRHMATRGLDAATPGIFARYRASIAVAIKGLFA
jgi:Bacteriophage HK97-gp10, putative tail-component